jgi:hypothetical protein
VFCYVLRKKNFIFILHFILPWCVSTSMWSSSDRSKHVISSVKCNTRQNFSVSQPRRVTIDILPENLKSQKLGCVDQDFSAFSRPEATFSLSYWFMGHKVINEDNLLKCHGNLVQCSQMMPRPTIANWFTQCSVNFFNSRLLVRYLTLLLLE